MPLLAARRLVAAHDSKNMVLFKRCDEMLVQHHRCHAIVYASVLQTAKLSLAENTLELVTGTHVHAIVAALDAARCFQRLRPIEREIESVKIGDANSRPSSR
jgi:hypothetical protein